MLNLEAMLEEGQEVHEQWVDLKSELYSEAPPLGRACVSITALHALRAPHGPEQDDLVRKVQSDPRLGELSPAGQKGVKGVTGGRGGP